MGIEDKSNIYTPVPTPVVLEKPIVDIAAGDEHSLALSDDGELFAWGYNEKSFLGDGTTTNRLEPVLIALPE